MSRDKQINATQSDAILFPPVFPRATSSFARDKRDFQTTRIEFRTCPIAGAIPANGCRCRAANLRSIPCIPEANPGSGSATDNSSRHSISGTSSELRSGDETPTDGKFSRIKRDGVYVFSTLKTVEFT